MTINMVKQLYVNNLQIIDIAANQLAATVNNTKDYRLHICIKNKQ